VSWAIALRLPFRPTARGWAAETAESLAILVEEWVMNLVEHGWPPSPKA